MIVPDYNKVAVAKIRILLDAGMINNYVFDLKELSQICKREITLEDLENLDDDTIDDSFAEIVLYGRPPRIDKFGKNEFDTLFENIDIHKYTCGQIQWIYEMIEIMFSLPTSYVVQHKSYNGLSNNELWNKIQAYRPICL